MQNKLTCPTIDRAHLDSLVELLGKEVINQIRLEYIHDSTSKMMHLLAAWNKRDYQALQDLSHSLKSASLNMALSLFADQCGKIESSAAQQNESKIHSVMNDLSAVHSNSLEVLEAYFSDDIQATNIKETN